MEKELISETYKAIHTDWLLNITESRDRFNVDIRGTKESEGISFNMSLSDNYTNVSFSNGAYDGAIIEFLVGFFTPQE